MIRRPPISTRTDTLFPSRRSSDLRRQCRAVPPVGLIDPLDDFLAPLMFEVDVDIGRLLALTRHETLRSEEHTSELQSLMRSSYAVFCLKKKKKRLFPSHATNLKSNHSISDQ